MKAVIEVGGRQYLVEQDQTIDVDLLHLSGKSTTFVPLLLIDGTNVQVGTPLIEKAKVAADVIEEDVKAPKVTAIRYKAKKRVHKTRGHRQHYTRLKITKIA